MTEERHSGTRDRPARKTHRPAGSSVGDQQQPAREHPKVRTAHGTRVARAIRCVRCGKQDTLHFIPRHQETALCRTCAAETLDIGDRDAGIVPGSEQAPSFAEGPPPPSTRRKTDRGVIRVRRKDDAED